MIDNNKENIPLNTTKKTIIEDKTLIKNDKKPSKFIYNHRRVETYCDVLNSIDDENCYKGGPFHEESKKLLNKSVLEQKPSIKPKESFENVGRLLKLLKQDAEKRIDSKRKANDVSYMTNTTASFIKPISSNNNNCKVITKEKNMKRSISTGISRKF